MDTKERLENGIRILEILGDIDLYSSPSLHKKWVEHSNKNKPEALVIDMQQSAYLDSSGIGVFIQILTDAKAKKIPFCLCNIQGMPEKILKLSKMNFLLPIETNLEKAIARIIQ